ncbi:(2Fe-2S)-binding protein [Alicyclobacillus fastidiosus]|uniref:(2Fe-2S)-binding protein n=1 Tax=Alicyclobacillus fastidiosus TaxID=392011 RepID=A0ABV5AEV3_9BACL|nr:(2Fe-2S)-binding protein [Alicyclobacillus fastidiosus]WEH12166.1 (2Fe-2S)-binding protein [Alicyclobacillus fastidiosus]
MPKREVVLHVNGEERVVHIRSADVLLDVLRVQLGLTGAKPGCENGDCGACTVLVGGQPYKSCIMLAIEGVGQSITTVEGLRDAPVQRAFASCYAFQCGYCTPGLIMNAHALVERGLAFDEREVQEWLESNICRCTSYEEIEKAVKSLCPPR